MKYRANIGLKSFIVFLSIMLVAMICIGVTGAVYQGSRRGIGTIVMNKGLYYTVENIYDDEGNLTISGKLQYYPSGDASGAKSDFELLDGVGQNESFLMAPPKIVVQSNSMSFYARAKIEYKYYTLNGSEYVPAIGSTLGVSLDTVTTELFSEKLEFNSRWKKSIDGYYYYVNAGTAIPTANSLALINASETIEIFANDKYTTGEWEGDYGGPYGIAKMDIAFVLEVVEKDGLDWAFYDIAELGVDFDGEIIDETMAIEIGASGPGYAISNIKTTKKNLILPESVMVDGVKYPVVSVGTKEVYGISTSNESSILRISSQTIENLFIPGSIKTLWNMAICSIGDGLSFCPTLKSITLGEGIEKIYETSFTSIVWWWVFSAFPCLEEINLPSTLKEIVYIEDLPISMFSSYCFNKINFSGNEYFSFDGTSLVDIKNKKLVAYLNNTSTFKVPDGVTIIEECYSSPFVGLIQESGKEIFQSFIDGGLLSVDAVNISKIKEYSSVFEKIEISSSLTGYEVSSDGHCLIKITGEKRELVMFAGKGLTEYTIPDSANITTITSLYGEDLQTLTFSSTIKSYTGGIYGMEKLSKIVLNEGLQEIKGNFSLKSLTELVLPSTLTKIDCSGIDNGDTSFGWSSLTKLTFTSDTPPTIPTMISEQLSPFVGADSFQIYVPKGKLSVYQEAYKNYSSFDWYKNMKESQ